MWQAPSHRIRALASAKRRQRERQRLAIHIKQVEGEVTIANAQGPAVPARIVLNDIAPKGVGVFTPEPFGIGQEVELKISKPKEINLRGRVAWCQEYDANSHILSQTPFSFRIGIVFSLDNSEDEQNVKSYCEELAKGYLYGVPAYAAPTILKKAA